MEVSLLKKSISSAELLQILAEQLSWTFDSEPQSVKLELRGVCDARQGGKQCIVFAPCMSFSEMEIKLESCFVLTESTPVCASDRNIYCVVSDARAAFIELLAVLIKVVGLKPFFSRLNLLPGISQTAVIASTAVIEPDVIIEDGAVISAGCVIKSGTLIGKNTVVRENTVIGIDGITLYKSKAGRLLKFPHVCGVRVGSDSEIGAGCIIPKGILASTVIGSHTVIGNLCNIGHGASVADSVWMSVGCLVGGHTHIGYKATIGMGACIRDNLKIGEGVAIGMGSVVVKDIELGLSVFGNPAKPMAMLATGPKR
jgi:acyl-[acyl carrier protein]--UDP-N-acetylglucosamine O-acyltransferase